MPAAASSCSTTPDGRSEFEGRGLHLLTDDEVDRLLAAETHRPSTPDFGARSVADAGARPPDPTADDRADAVVIGDASDAMTFRDLDRAFGLIRQGADFIAMHRNKWWLTPRGTTLDAGALVAGLEYSSERRATLAGQAVAGLLRRRHPSPGARGRASQASTQRGGR